MGAVKKYIYSRRIYQYFFNILIYIRVKLLAKKSRHTSLEQNRYTIPLSYIFRRKTLFRKRRRKKNATKKNILFIPEADRFSLLFIKKDTPICSYIFFIHKFLRSPSKRDELLKEILRSVK